MVKILLIVMSEEEEKIRMPLNFIKNQSQAGNEIRVIFWGPSEKTLAANDQLRKEYNSFATVKPKACVNSAKKYNLDAKLSSDIELIPVGEYIRKSIEEGYEIITF
ncbi:MAG: DsrE family protein [Candidatus Micrarchaeaceae archaeon]